MLPPFSGVVSVLATRQRVAALVAAALVLREAVNYYFLSKSDRRKLLRAVWNLHRWSPVTVLNLVRFALSSRGLTYLRDYLHFQRHPTVPSPGARRNLPPLSEAPPAIFQPVLPIGESSVILDETTSYWVSPSFAISRKEDACLPPFISERIRAPSAAVNVCRNDFEGRDLVWGETLGSKLYFHWCVPSEAMEALAELDPGHQVPQSWMLNHADLAKGLVAAELLYTPSMRAAAESLWEARIQVARASLAATDIAVLASVLPKGVEEAARMHSRSVKAFGALARANEGYVFRWNCPSASYLNHQLTPMMGRLVGEAVKPERSITLFYEDGSLLPLHVDTPPYAFSMSLALDEQKLRTDAQPFPLSIVSRSVWEPLVDVELPLGSAVVFVGGSHHHYRGRAIGVQHTSVSLSFDRLNF